MRNRIRADVLRALRLFLLAALPATGLLSASVITSFTASTLDGYAVTYTPGFAFELGLLPQVYSLNDSTSWPSGAGSFEDGSAMITSVTTVGDTVRYTLTATADPILQFTDFSFGDHSAQGSFGAIGPLTLEAQIGSRDAVLSGDLLLESNDPTYYPTFNYFAAPVGSLVPFTETYELSTGGWSAATFDSSFSYTAAGEISFAPEPATMSLYVLGFLALAPIGWARRHR